MGKCDLPAWMEPKLPVRRVRPSRGKAQAAVSPLATWPFHAEVLRIRAVWRMRDQHARRRAEAIAAAGGEEAWREKRREVAVATIRRNNQAFLAKLSPEELRARMSALGKKGAAASWGDAEAYRAHMAKLGRANISALNARVAAMSEEERAAWFAERGRRVSAGRLRGKGQS